MNRFNVSDARKEQLKRTAVGIVKEPKAIMAIGALILAIGMYSAIQTALLPILTVVGGGIGLGIGTSLYRNMMRHGFNRNRRQDRQKRNRLWFLLALAPAISAMGFFYMWRDTPIQSSIVLMGALVLGIGIMQIKRKRARPAKSREKWTRQASESPIPSIPKEPVKSLEIYGDSEQTNFGIGGNNMPVNEAGLEFNDAVYYLSRGVDELTEDIASQPNSAAPYFHRGTRYRHMNLHELALTDLNKAISLDPNHALAYLNRGSIYLSAGMYDAAIDDYSRTIALSPRDPRAYRDRANAYYAIGRNDLAAIDQSTFSNLKEQLIQSMGIRDYRSRQRY